MNNNDVLRRLRYALNLNDSKMIEIFALSGTLVNTSALMVLMSRESEPDFVPCKDDVLRLFLDGLITHRRGPRTSAPRGEEKLSNNMILRKLRIALKFQEQDMLEVLRLGGRPLSSSELSALFRKSDHRHYRACGDQLLRNFLKGLSLKLRGTG